MSFFSTRRSIPDPTTGDTASAVLTSLTDAGVTIPQETLDAVEELQAKRQGIKILRQEADPDTASIVAAQAIADGTGTITDVLNAVGAKTLLSKTHGSEFTKLFDEALRLNSRAIIKELSTLGDTWITDIMRPRVDELVATIRAAHNANTPAEPMRDPRHLEYVRHVNGITDAMADLKAIYGAAGYFRSYEVIPSQHRREDGYQFKTPYPNDSNYEDHIKPDNLTWFFWADQHDITPGIYTDDEVAARD